MPLGEYAKSKAATLLGATTIKPQEAFTYRAAQSGAAKRQANLKAPKPEKDRL